MGNNNPFSRQGDYETFEVEHGQPLLEFLLEHVKTLSRSKIKQTLQGRGVIVNGKPVTQFDFPLKSGMKVAVSRSKKNNETLRSRYVRIVYEDRWLVVVEKQAGILSMAAGHSSLNVKAVLDDYFRKARQPCNAHVVHRLDRDTSGLMVYAKDKQTEQQMERSWHQMVYDRRYVAVVSGQMEQDSGTIQSYLKDNKAFFTYSSPTDNGGKLDDAVGIPEDQLRKAAKSAVCKINIDSDLRLAMTASIRKYFNEHPDHFDPRQYLSPARDAIREMVKHKIVDVLGCDGKA